MLDQAGKPVEWCHAVYWGRGVAPRMPCMVMEGVAFMVMEGVVCMVMGAYAVAGQAPQEFTK